MARNEHGTMEHELDTEALRARVAELEAEAREIDAQHAKAIGVWKKAEARYRDLLTRAEGDFKLANEIRNYFQNGNSQPMQSITTKITINKGPA
jgi:hypothetical protein